MLIIVQQGCTSHSHESRRLSNHCSEMSSLAGLLGYHLRHRLNRMGVRDSRVPLIMLLFENNFLTSHCVQLAFDHLSSRELLLKPYEAVLAGVEITQIAIDLVDRGDGVSTLAIKGGVVVRPVPQLTAFFFGARGGTGNSSSLRETNSLSCWGMLRLDGDSLGRLVKSLQWSPSPCK
jgi:hypothetical protein